MPIAHSSVEAIVAAALEPRWRRTGTTGLASAFERGRDRLEVRQAAALRAVDEHHAASTRSASTSGHVPKPGSRRRALHARILRIPSSSSPSTAKATPTSPITVTLISGASSVSRTRRCRPDGESRCRPSAGSRRRCASATCATLSSDDAAIGRRAWRSRRQRPVRNGRKVARGSLEPLRGAAASRGLSGCAAGIVANWTMSVGRRLSSILKVSCVPLPAMHTALIVSCSHNSLQTSCSPAGPA